MANKFFKTKQGSVTVDNLGWSSSVDDTEGRVVNKDGSFNLVREGEQYHIYHILISMAWWQFFALILLLFTLLNGFFSLVYYAIGTEYIANFVSTNFFMDIVNLFHFSVQTMTTVGYGYLHPIGAVTSVVTSFESLLGLLSFALASGLMYGRFSNPKAEIKYAKNLLITQARGRLSLQARIANKLSHDLFDIQATILMLHNEKADNGLTYRRYKTLDLEIDNISFLPMNWTITHFVDAKSPLHGMDMAAMKEQNVEFLVLITAFDDSFSQLVHSRSSYLSDEIILGGQFQKTYYVNEKGERVFDLDLLDKIIDEAQ